MNTMNTKAGLLTALLLAMGATGCANVDSSDIRTSGMHANVKLVADGTATVKATTSLRVGGATSNTFVELVEGDALTVTVAETTKDMGERSALGAYWYEAALEASVAAPDVDVVFDFTRAEGESALGSTVSLPQPFGITAPVPDASIAIGTGVEVTIDDAAGDNMDVTIEAPCIKNFHKPVPAAAMGLTIAADELEARESNAEDVTECQGTLEVRRTREGTLSDAYGEGGTAQAVQVRSLDVTITL